MNGGGLRWAMATDFSRAKVFLMKRWSDTVMLWRNFFCLLAASAWSSLAVSSSNMWFLWSVLWVPLINRVWKSATDNQWGDEQQCAVPVGSPYWNILHELMLAKAKQLALHEEINLRYYKRGVGKRQDINACVSIVSEEIFTVSPDCVAKKWVFRFQTSKTLIVSLAAFLLAKKFRNT